MLFDIDGTLIMTGGAGSRAVAGACNALFPVEGNGSRFDDVPLAGRTDRWIFAEYARRRGVDIDDVGLARLRAVYLEHLIREIREPSPSKRVLPGVRALLNRLSGHDEVCLGLLTGNVADGAQIKLEHFDLWRYFVAGGFGDAALDRTAMFTAALKAVFAICGVEFAPEDVVVVGDTPLDVAVAVETGARSVAVATGTHSAESLWDAGADEVLADLGDLNAALRALQVPDTSPTS
ncbi:MAG: HAD family hydrolase [Acidimicrobiia bacterium]|nr:HAD family hydrolase [Acidimicrobiia bacterium]